MCSLVGGINSLTVDKETLPLFCGVMMSKAVGPIKLSSILAHSSHLVIWLITIWRFPWSLFCTYIMLIILLIVVVLRKCNTCQSLILRICVYVLYNSYTVLGHHLNQLRITDRCLEVMTPCLHQLKVDSDIEQAITFWWKFM